MADKKQSYQNAGDNHSNGSQEYTAYIDEEKTPIIGGLPFHLQNTPESKAYNVLCGLTFTVVSLVVLFIVPASYLAVGIYFKDDCPVNKMIPGFMIAMGAMGLASAIIRLVQICIRNDPERCGCMLKVLSASHSLLGLGMLAFFIAGCYWTYSVYSTVTYDPAAAADTYCHRAAYLFAFSMLSIKLSLIGVSVLTCVCVCFCGAFNIATFVKQVKKAEQ